MATREEFGKYLLLKKLTEDPLGETFRAGRVGAQGMEQVVLLRALNGPRLDTARLVEALPARAPIQEGLKSPNIGNGVDLGDVKGVPFIAYDYISGKNLATLLAEADRQGTPIALDHALLIVERIAQALAVAFETRLDDQRLLHGFVVPPLVRVSNEGETRLLGFEVGPILQELAGRGIFEPSISAYLAPEVLAGEPPAKSDDIYSLGALLFELLTATPPTASDPEGLVREIDRAQVASEQSPIPAPLATLLKKSLTPRDNRIPEAVSWHKALTKIMVEGQYNATTFNLAFFMHNLFRAEIERETQELEQEKQIKAGETVAPPPMPEEGAPAEGEPAIEATGTHASYAAGPGGQRSRTGLWVGLAAALLVLVGGGWYFFLGPGAEMLSGFGSSGETETADETTTQPALPEPEPVDLPPSPLDETVTAEEAEEEAAQAEEEAEELQAQIQKMISESNQDLEAKFKAEYEAKIQQLQRQLADTQAAAERAREEARRREETAVAAEPSPAEEDTEETRLAEADSTDTETEPERTDAPDTTADSSGGETSAEVADTIPQQPADRPAPTETASSARRQPEVRQPDRPAAETPSRTTQPATPQEPAQVTPPEIVREPQARYPQIARRMGRRATVLLRVLVDSDGEVAEVERIGKRVGSGFDEAAIQAARQARFKPGTEDGKAKAMWTTLRIEFRPPG